MAVSTVNCDTQMRRVVLLCLLHLTLAASGSAEKCAKFAFPTIPNMTIAATEGTEIILPFKLDSSQCHVVMNETYVYVKPPKGNDYCAVRLNSEDCQSTNIERCPCVNETSAEMIKTVREEDVGVWEWRTGNGEAIAEINLITQGQDAVKYTVRYTKQEWVLTTKTTARSTTGSKPTVDLEDKNPEGTTESAKVSTERAIKINEVRQEEGWMKVVFVVNFFVIIIVVVVVAGLCWIRRSQQAKKEVCVNTPLRATKDAVNDTTSGNGDDDTGNTSQVPSLI